MPNLSKRPRIARLSALFLTGALFAASLISCDNLAIKKTYPDSEIINALSRLCEKEYNIDVRVSVTGNTVWVYYPVEKMLDAKNQLDETIHKKLGNIYLCLERVILSTTKKIDFFVIDISDITVGIDFLTIGYLMDMKKFLVSSVSRNDYLNRMIRKVNYNPAAVNDKEGKHINKFDIKFTDFIVNLIVDRIQNTLRANPKLAINYLSASFENGVVSLPYDIVETDESNPEIKTGIKAEEIFPGIVASVLQGYVFGEFKALELHDMRNDKKTVYTKIELKKVKPLLPSVPQS